MKCDQTISIDRQLNIVPPTEMFGNVEAAKFLRGMASHTKDLKEDPSYESILRRKCMLSA